jgi:L-methionine (R)-S-oxide reductase
MHERFHRPMPRVVGIGPPPQRRVEVFLRHNASACCVLVHELPVSLVRLTDLLVSRMDASRAKCRSIREAASFTRSGKQGKAAIPGYGKGSGSLERAVKPGHQFAIDLVDSALRAVSPIACSLAEVCRILQRLPGYTGVYIYALEDDTLVLKASQGRATEHTRIPAGSGICGASVQAGASVIVADVGSDSRYLACNLQTKSEIVVPILRGATYLAQIDVDSDERASFDADDEAFLAEVARRLEPLF